MKKWRLLALLLVGAVLIGAALLYRKCGYDAIRRLFLIEMAKVSEELKAGE